MLELQFTYSPWYLVPVALLLALLLYGYYFWRSEFSKKEAWLLASFRFLLLFLLAVFLLRPQWVKRESYALKPILLWLEDQSASMTFHSDSLLWDSMQTSLSLSKEKLAEKYQVQTYGFAETLDRDSVQNNSYTNIQGAIAQAKDLYYSEPLGAMVLISDGIYNQGFSPIDVNSQNLPIFSIAYGNSEQQRDLGIADLRYNKKVSLGRSLSVELDLKAQNALGSQFGIQLSDENGLVISERNFNVNQEDWFESLLLEIPCEKEGMQVYEVQIMATETDANPSNNQASIAFKVQKEAQKVVVYSKGLHPDVKAIRSAIAQDLNYELEYTRQISDKTLDEAQIIVAFDWDASLVAEIANRKIPSLLLAGAKSDLKSLEKLDLGLGWTNELEEQFAEPQNSGLFPWPQTEQELWGDWPPLEGIYGSVEKPNWAEVVFSKRIVDLATEEIIALSGERDGHRLGIIGGRGIWRWRMYDYRQHKNTQAFDNFFRNWMDYLNAQERERALEIEFASNIYEGESSQVIGKLFDPSGKMLNTPDLALELSNKQGEKYDYRFSREANFYRLKLDGLKAGFYEFKASCSLGNQDYRREGRIWVQENTLEQQDLKARRSLLRTLAENSGGQYFELQESQNLDQAILSLNQAQELRERKIKSDLLSKWKLFFVALVLLSLEWFLRKYWGSY